jgi:plasmid stability protein
MTNLTISLDESIVRGARIRAIQEGTSLSAKVREYLRQYVEGSGAQEAQLRQTATAQLMDSISKASAASKQTRPVKAKGATLRDALYEEDFRSKARVK